MMLVKTYVAQSGIHGIGLFAEEPIAAGTKIWHYMGGMDVVFDASLLETLQEPMRSYLARYTYPHHSFKDKIILDGDNGRFMNHSDTPNTDFSQLPMTAGYALRDIAKGEELTCNYNEFAPGFVLD